MKIGIIVNKMDMTDSIKVLKLGKKFAFANNLKIIKMSCKNFDITQFDEFLNQINKPN